MAKAKSRYVCNNCGEDFPQMYGKCPACSSWGVRPQYNTIIRQQQETHTD